MTIQDALQKYLEARQAGDDHGAAELASAVNDLFQAVKKARLKYDLEWYATQLFVDGDHWLRFDKQAGRVTTSDALQGTDRKKIRRFINLIRSQLRGLKNFVQKIPLTVEVVPNPKGNSEVEKRSAERTNMPRDTTLARCG